MTVSSADSLQTTPDLTAIARQTRQAAMDLAILPTEAKNQAIAAVADALEANADKIVAANQQDCEQAITTHLAKPLYGRLKLDAVKLKGAIAGVRDVASLRDPVGTVQ
ncbi:gamma-glutamyl-phosphate reductase, partial [filamentous cyanobacterium CCP5]